MCVLSYNNLPESQLDDYFNQSYQFKFNNYVVIGWNSGWK